jgi:hypothetical protein
MRVPSSGIAIRLAQREYERTRFFKAGNAGNPSKTLIKLDLIC